MAKKLMIHLKVNGNDVAEEVTARTTLVDFLRYRLGLTGTHVGCEHGICGACTVLCDGKPIRSCLMLAIQADGRELATVEGLQKSNGDLDVLQDCLRETHGLQCGYCTSGILMAAEALLKQNVSPTRDEIREAISGNLCRCTGYLQIIEGIELASRRMRDTK